MMILNKRIAGFTLLEVLVALAILAIALAAVIKSTTENAENLRYLRDKTLAQWVARNVITDLQVRNQWPDLGETKGQARMANQDWYWTLQVSETMDKELRRLDVQVRDREEAREPVGVLVGFVGAP